MTIRWGIIGTGDVTEHKSGPAFDLAERSSLLGVFNRTQERAEAWAARHGNPQVYNSAAELVRDPNINAIYIATPPSSHAEYTALAADAGKHVYCEKPMAMTVVECLQMIQACKASGVSLSIAYYRRCFPVVQKMQELVRAGAIGRPLRVSAKTYSRFSSPASDPWRLDSQISGGGFLMDMGTHRFDLFEYFFGAPKQVTAITGSQSLQSNVEDSASIAMEFDRGIHGSAAFHWNSPVEFDELEILGSEGLLTTDSLSNQGRLRLETGSSTESWELPAPKPVQLNLIERVVCHLLDGTPNPCSGESAMIANQIVEQAYRAPNA